MSIKNITQRRATLELLFATAVWGFGFIATRWTLEISTPLATAFIRFAIAAAVTLPFIPKKAWKGQFALAAVPGIFLGLTLILQTWGLQFTSATNSGFITTLYVLFVPLIEVFTGERKIKLFHFIFVAIALIGTALICNLQNFVFNRGDLLTLACAVAGAFQIFWIGRVAKYIKSSFAFNTFQAMWAASIPLALGLILSLFGQPIFVFKSASPEIMTRALIGFASLSLGSSLIAFLIQIRAQKVLSASVASLIFLLESPFAALFAYYSFNEQLSSIQWVGVALILLATLSAVFTETKV